MDCHEAQAQLELSTLKPEAANRPAVIEARQHLKDCDACHLAVNAMQRFDQGVAQAMTAVPLPDGLLERLHAAVQSASSVTVAKAIESSPSRLKRRVAAATITVAALLLMLVWFFPREAKLGVADVQRIAGIDLNRLPIAPPGSSFAMPAGWQSLRGLEFGNTPRLTQEGDSAVAVMPFLVQTDRRSSHLTGMLIVVPESRWQTRPLAESMSSAAIQYAPFGTWVVWREHGTVFVCVLRDDTRAMERLQHFVASGRELT